MRAQNQNHENDQKNNAEHRDRVSEERNFRDRDENRQGLRKRPKPPVDLIFDYKDVESIRSFVSDGGKLVPVRMSRLSSKQQRQLTKQVKRARHLALLPIKDSRDGQ